ncbi:MAG: hypothetical protein JSW67_11610 [Candidatus Latescibacterota bacterium]|nr:MAG: hypothetical protein JSW67_11610 [Candidatus Latescibacterota bacterium]
MDVLGSRIDTQGRAYKVNHATMSELVAPMPGQVLKMRYEIVAPRDGVVAQVCAAEGEQVAGGAMLVALEEEPTEAS